MEESCGIHKHTRTHTYIHTPSIFHISISIWTRHARTYRSWHGDHVICAHIFQHKPKGIRARKHRAIRTHLSWPTPLLCVNLPAFLANLQHNGTPVFAFSLLPPVNYRGVYRGTKGHWGPLNIFMNKQLIHPSLLILSPSQFIPLFIFLPLSLDPFCREHVFPKQEESRLVFLCFKGAVCYHSNRHSGYCRSWIDITGKRGKDGAQEWFS